MYCQDLKLLEKWKCYQTSNINFTSREKNPQKPTENGGKIFISWLTSMIFDFPYWSSKQDFKSQNAT